MILTTCAACAAPLAHDAPRCVRCKLRYCNATCQHDHWRRGHKQMCKKIHRGGNAEQYNANKKYKEAVAVAVEACADSDVAESSLRVLGAAKAHETLFAYGLLLEVRTRLKRARGDSADVKLPPGVAAKLGKLRPF